MQPAPVYRTGPPAQQNVFAAPMMATNVTVTALASSRVRAPAVEESPQEVTLQLAAVMPGAELDEVGAAGFASPRAGEYTLARPADVKRHVVHVCGRTVLIPDGVESISGVTRILQQELGMQDQVFELFDIMGKRLYLESDMKACIEENKTPITANLSDSCIHFIENRREELAQMQWKLVRDQHNQAQLKLAAFMRKMESVEAAFTNLERDTEAKVERLRGEMTQSVESARDKVRAEARQLGERVSGVGQLVTAERNKREIGTQQQNKALQGMREMLEQQSSANQDAVSQMISLIRENRQKIEEERIARDGLKQENQIFRETIQNMLMETEARLQQVVQDYQGEFKKSTLEARSTVEQHERSAKELRNSLELTQNDQAAKLQLLEDRVSTAETRLQWTQERADELFDKHHDRNDFFNREVEQMKWDCGKQNRDLDEYFAKLQNVEQEQVSSDKSNRDTYHRDRQDREAQLASMREHILSEYSKSLQGLESKVMLRVDAESENRRAHVKAVMENVTTALKAKGVDEPEKRIAVTQAHHQPPGSLGGSVQGPQGPASITAPTVTGPPRLLSSPAQMQTARGMITVNHASANPGILQTVSHHGHSPGSTAMAAAPTYVTPQPTSLTLSPAPTSLISQYRSTALGEPLPMPTHFAAKTVMTPRA